jgi:hypothetical protein
MEKFTREELEEALKSINSTINKCEKAQNKLAQNSSQWTLLIRRIKAFKISIALIKKELNENKC